MTYSTREQWLNAAVDAVRPWFVEAGKPLPDQVKVSIGWGFRSPMKTLGECWTDEVASDSLRHIFIAPRHLSERRELAGPQGILATLIHELCHAALPHKTMHRKPFQRLAEAMGLTGPWTATSAGAELQTKLITMVRELGDFPGGHLTPAVKTKTQKNRHHKCECGECGYIARVSKMHLQAIGAPLCPAGHGQMTSPFDVDGEDEGGEE